ncbi:MAG TPA: hypothetical protein DCG06_01945, partial [Deltaproteobacteria bacterium]|nr:hypothetical protein [Deltaproteobacteria bacterium]
PWQSRWAAAHTAAHIVTLTLVANIRNRSIIRDRSIRIDDPPHVAGYWMSDYSDFDLDDKASRGPPACLSAALRDIDPLSAVENSTRNRPRTPSVPYLSQKHLSTNVGTPPGTLVDQKVFAQ